MIRRYNYTNRLKLPKKCIDLRVFSDETGLQHFEASLNFAGYTLPEGAKIYLEAYYRNSMMRFPVGKVTVGRTEYNCTGALTELQDPQVNFRVKIVDERQHIGRIVALADRIQTFNQDSKQYVQVGLLPVKFADLADQIWMLELSDDGTDPVLCINNTLDTGNIPIAELVRNYPLFLALVYPQVVRTILEHLMIEKQGDFDEADPESWGYKWITFAESQPGVNRHPEGDDEDESRQWINEVVNAFCAQNKIKMAFEKYVLEMQS